MQSTGGMNHHVFPIEIQAFSKSAQGYILDKHYELKQIIPFDADPAFSLEYHPTMLGLAQHMKTFDLSSDVVLSDEVSLLFFDLCCY